MFGKQWDTIQKYVGTRDVKNVRAHSQKFFMKLVKQLENKDTVDAEEIQHAEKFYSILNNKFIRDDKYAPHNKNKKKIRGLQTDKILYEIPK